MNMEQTGKIAVDSATHSQVGDSAAETIKERFGKEYLPGGSWKKISKEHVYNLWKGYKWMIRDVFSKPVGNYNAKREQWLIDYLRVFEQEDYRPVDAIIALRPGVPFGTSFLSFSNRLFCGDRSSKEGHGRSRRLGSQYSSSLTTTSPTSCRR